jgi:hypothetical protein
MEACGKSKGGFNMRRDAMVKLAAVRKPVENYILNVQKMLRREKRAFAKIKNHKMQIMEGNKMITVTSDWMVRYLSGSIAAFRSVLILLDDLSEEKN